LLQHGNQFLLAIFNGSIQQMAKVNREGAFPASIYVNNGLMV
jgi:hypothetical protein